MLTFRSAALRYLSAYMVSEAGGGHLGMPLGFADVMSVLTSKFLNYNPKNPKWFNRDRLILSSGHGSSLLYAFYFLAGYEDCSFQDLKDFRKFGAKASSHPEYRKFAATETTTGLLGQGFATSVGMAIAQKKYEALIGPELCNYKTYCIVGDGCLMEGISYEAASLAGHLKLNNLIVLFDDNRTTSDGSTDSIISENQLLKFHALGWEVESVDGHDYHKIEEVLERAQVSSKPCFIAFRTIPGYGTSKNDHIGGISKEDLQILSNIETGCSDQNINSFFRLEYQPPLNSSSYEIWKRNFEYASDYQKSIIDQTRHDITLSSCSSLECNNQPTRKIAGMLLENIMQQKLLGDKVIIGSADLGKSTCIKYAGAQEISSNDFSGNYLNYGIREHAMGAIMNGLALSGFTAIASTFLSFSDYMRPAIRMAAMQKLPVIYFLTHDSILVGEDGPTHQPIEHLDSFKIMPGVNIARPYNMDEMIESMQIALNGNESPTIFALSRQDVIHRVCSSSTRKADIGIFASGSDVQIAYEVYDILNKQGYNVEVISLPFWPANKIPYYEDEDFTLRVAIEMGTGISFQKIIGTDGILFNISNFGVAGRGERVQEYFGLNAKKIACDVTLRKALA